MANGKGERDLQGNKRPYYGMLEKADVTPIEKERAVQRACEDYGQS